MTDADRQKTRKAIWAAAMVLIAVSAVVAWSRVGVLDLPPVPKGLTLDDAGLADLASLMQVDAYVRGTADASTLDDPGLTAATREAARLVREGTEAVERGDAAAGLELMRQGVRLDPSNTVFPNAYRMVTFRLKRAYLGAAKRRAALTPEFPPHLADQPIVFFEELDRHRGTRETKLHLALAWVDHMLLFPALEIKAPASVEAVDLLTEMLDRGREGYVPALFARGLNHLHRPARLVWPESAGTPKDAAAQDIGRCVAIGRKFGVGSRKLQATLAIALGDAYVKAGRLGVARSWWQIAQNICGDQGVQDAIRRRYGWHDEEILDRLEEELDRSRAELDRPMTDLAMMWN